MRTKSVNPFLPKTSSIRWRVGAAAGTVGLPETKPVRDAAATVEDAAEAKRLPYTKDPRGRKPKSTSIEHSHSERLPPRMRRRRLPKEYAHAGLLNHDAGSFSMESISGWGSNLDMLALAHGPVGCGVFTQASRGNVPVFAQGIDSFTTLHLCTNLSEEDLEDGGDAKLSRAFDECLDLFPLGRGVSILNEDPIAIIDANVQGFAKSRTKELKRLVVSCPCESIRNSWSPISVASGLKAAAQTEKASESTRYDVALPFFREAAGLVWLIDKLLRDIGLTPVHELTGSSVSDMARIHGCKLVVGFSGTLDIPVDFFRGGHARLLKAWFDMPLEWACFVGPSATDASLRAIASHFDSAIRARAEATIAANRKRIDEIVARYRPRLEGKLVVHFYSMTEEELEPYRLLGMRIGNCGGWPSKSGVRRKPRLVCDPAAPSDRALDAYIAEAKPDLILSRGLDEFEWRKRGQRTPTLSLLCDRWGNSFWTYDGFACLAAMLDRTINAPWSKLVKPPWATGGGR